MYLSRDVNNEGICGSWETELPFGRRARWETVRGRASGCGVRLVRPDGEPAGRPTRLAIVNCTQCLRPVEHADSRCLFLAIPTWQASDNACTAENFRAAAANMIILSSFEEYVGSACGAGGRFQGVSIALYI